MSTRHRSLSASPQNDHDAPDARWNAFEDAVYGKWQALKSPAV